MNNIVFERLHKNLERLKLNRINEIIDNYFERAVKDNISLVDAIDYLINEERIFKDETSLIMRTNVAGFPFRKTFEQFDFNFQSSIDTKIINDLKTMRFIHNSENVIFLGPPGVGKTHLSIALGLEAIKNRFSTYYINCHEMIEQLNKAHFENRLKNKLKTYSKYKVLVIDEVGYLPFDKQGANLFFQLITRKYEKSSIILSSNRSFSDWGDIFNDNIIASAILDRLLHHSTVINIKGNSYRLKERKHTFTNIGGDNFN
jgi:DNA replication protein DnaC